MISGIDLSQNQIWNMMKTCFLPCMVPFYQYNKSQYFKKKARNISKKTLSTFYQ